MLTYQVGSLILDLIRANKIKPYHTIYDDDIYDTTHDYYQYHHYIIIHTSCEVMDWMEIIDTNTEYTIYQTDLD